MSAATAVKKTTGNRKAKTRLSAVPSAPGSIVIPGKCKPSQGASDDRTRPILTHAYLRRHDGDLWLCTTDSYIAIALKVTGDAQEGYIPIGALRLMERGQKAEQVSTTAWKVWTKEGTVVFDCDDSISGTTAYPDLAKLGIFEQQEKNQHDPIAPDKAGRWQVGMNPKFMKRIADALGAGDYGCKFEFVGQLKPIRVLPLQGSGSDRIALLMPIRITV